MTDEERKRLIVPTSCPVCGWLLRSSKYWWKFGCCGLCFVFFVEGREERWLAGWRPSPEQLEAMKSATSS
jgi:hypothetical protein